MPQRSFGYRLETIDRFESEHADLQIRGQLPEEHQLRKPRAGEPDLVRDPRLIREPPLGDRPFEVVGQRESPGGSTRAPRRGRGRGRGRLRKRHHAPPTAEERGNDDLGHEVPPSSTSARPSPSKTRTTRTGPGRSSIWTRACSATNDSSASAGNPRPVQAPWRSRPAHR